MQRDKITERLIKMLKNDPTQEAYSLNLSRKITRQKVSALREELEATNLFKKVEFSDVPKGTVITATKA